MEELDFRVITYLVWGVGTTLVYGYVLVRRIRSYERRRDKRARRELMTGFGLFLTAFAANLAILVVLFGREAGQDARSFFVALSLGAFFAVGINLATENSETV